MEFLTNKTEKLSAKEKQPLVFCNPRKADKDVKLPLWRKIGFAVGSMPYTMTSTVIAYYLTYFLLEVALMDPTYVLSIVFIGRVWDAISDPICGYLSSRTKTKLGQFRPWLLFSAIPAGVAYFFLWYVPTFNSPILSFIYYLVMYLLVQTTFTCIHVPYTSLTMHLSYNQKQTDSVTLYRVVFELIGTLLSNGMFTLLFAVFVGDSANQNSCVQERHQNLPLERTFRYHALSVAILIVIMTWITFFTVKEQTDITDKKSYLSIFGALKETWKCRAYRDLFFIELFSWLAVQFAQGNLVFYIRYTLKLGDLYPYMILLILITITLCLPMLQICLNKFGKKTALLIGAWVFMPSVIILLYLDHFPYLVWVIGLPVGAGVASIYLLPWSMVPDVVDSASLKSGIRREEFFYSFFVFGNKFSAGLTLALSTGLYKLAGYDQLSCSQPWTVPLLFKLLVTVPPILFLLISLIFLYRYPITEATRAEIKQMLLSRRKHETEGRNNDLITPSTPSTSSISTSDLTVRVYDHTSDENTLEGGLQIKNT